MPLTQVDFTASNNADWKRSLTFNTGVAATIPWNAVAPWAASTLYQSTSPASLVVFGSDLYVANPSNSPTSWTSTSTFAGESAKWVKVADHIAFNPIPYDLTGASLHMAIADPGGNVKLTLSTTEETLLITDAAAGAVSIAAPALTVRALTPGDYSYDMLAVFSGPRIVRLMFGTITVVFGPTPP